MVQQVVGYRGRIVNDLSKPDGTPRKLLDVSRLHALGWQARRTLQDGLASTYEWFLENQASFRS
jgi:GDP-L-fucose synthase